MASGAVTSPVSSTSAPSVALRDVTVASGTVTSPVSSTNVPSVALREVTVDYGAVAAVHQVTADFHAGTVTVVMGRNGAGKSSLLWAIQGAAPSGGDVTVTTPRGAVDPRRLTPAQARSHVTLVPQTAADLLYRDTVEHECAQADQESQAEPGATAAILARMGARPDPALDPRDLSEGTRLALVLAIQLVARPAVVLLDEPTRGLDYTMKDHLTNFLRVLADEGKCVIVATHDVEFAAGAADRVVIMAEGDIVADGPAATVLTSSPAYAPQVAKVFWPAPVLTVADLAAWGIAGGGR